MYSRLPADIEYDPNGFHHAWRGFPSVPKVYLWQVPLLESITRLMFGEFGVETQGAYSIKQCSVRRVGRKWHIMMEQIVTKTMLDDADIIDVDEEQENRMVVNDTWWMLNEWNANAEGWMMDDAWWMNDWWLICMTGMLTDGYDSLIWSRTNRMNDIVRNIIWILGRGFAMMKNDGEPRIGMRYELSVVHPEWWGMNDDLWQMHY